MRHLAIVLLCFLCVPAIAGDAGDRAKLAQRLADLIEIRAQYNGAYELCRRTDANFEKEMLDLYATRQADFGGISPKSAYWSEARAIYREYLDSACALTSGEKLEPMFVDAYARSMSVAELRAAVKFSSSPTGRAMQAANKKIFRDVAERAYRDVADDQAKAALIFRQSMLILKNKYKAKPQ